MEATAKKNVGTLSGQVREYILTKILNGEFEPGERLIEMKIAHQMQTSQAPVREAIRELEATGLLETLPNRGSRVRKVSNQELFDIYDVRAQLEGYDCMVKLTDEAEYMILEGDEYLSSPIDRRPKFHLYNPDVAIISGIAWDHINVFPTFDIYKNQFKIFIDKIINGGVLIYNDEDLEILSLIKTNQNYIRKMPYSRPNFIVKNNKFFIETDEGLLPLKVFGNHNMENLSGAKQVCNLIGVTDDEFYNSITTFSGASNRLQVIETKFGRSTIRDFAHSPSKLKASIDAVKTNFDGELVGVYELHTFSSFDEKFQIHYRGSLDLCDYPIIFIDKSNPKLTNIDFDEESLRKSFNNHKVKFIYGKDDLNSYIMSLDQQNLNLLLMSSGKFGGLDVTQLSKNFCNNAN